MTVLLGFLKCRAEMRLAKPSWVNARTKWGIACEVFSTMLGTWLSESVTPEPLELHASFSDVPGHFGDNFNRCPNQSFSLFKSPL